MSEDKESIGDEVKKKLSKRGRLSRNKGKKFEQEVAKDFRGLFPGARRYLEYHSSDANGYDLMSTGRLLVQCKAHRKYAPMSTIDEVQKRYTTDIPVVVTKADYCPVLVALKFTDFLRILEDPGIIFRGFEGEMAPGVLEKWGESLTQLVENLPEPTDAIDMMR